MKTHLAVALLATCCLPAALGSAGSALVATGETKLTAFDAARVDQFGRSVALSGDRLLVGAPTHDDAGTYSGSAYVFARNVSTGNWEFEAKLAPSDAAADDQFGGAVALDGTTAVIGAVGNDGSRGAAYVFARDASGAWHQEAKFTDTTRGVGDGYATSVAIDGDTVLVGSSRDIVGGFRRGSVFVYVRTPGTSTWSEQARLNSSVFAINGGVGFSVSISGDTAIAGAIGTGEGRGTAYVFVRDAASGTWTQQAILTSETFDTQFGRAVSVDGDTAIIGAPGGVSFGSGAAFVFTRNGASGVWTRQVRLSGGSGRGFDEFGGSVSLDGNSVLIGAPRDRERGFLAGAVYMFTRDGTDRWTQALKLTPSDATRADQFGWAASLSGRRALVGSPFDDDACVADIDCESGSAYVFELEESTLPTADAGLDQTVECSEPGCALVTLDGSGSSDPAGGGLTYRWSDASNTELGTSESIAVTLPLGQHVITLTVASASGAIVSDQVVVTVADTTAPQITGAVASPDVLWPPNHQMIDVTVDVDVSDVCDSTPTCRIVAVTSSDSGNDFDVTLTGDLTVQLRAERAGNDDGRSYTLWIECADDSGNKTTRTIVVVAPHSQGLGSNPTGQSQH